MQQPTTRQLYAYWDAIRNGRIAPHRFEIEPAKIAGLLRETFVAECNGLLGFRFRLAGTRICLQFGRELRGVDFLSFWSNEDRNAIAAMTRSIVRDGAVGYGTFSARTETNREAAFEFAVLPLIHTGSSINRILGAITAIEPPFWLGTETLMTFSVIEIQSRRPDDIPTFMTNTAAEVVHRPRRGFRVIEGGLSRSD